MGSNYLALGKSSPVELKDKNGSFGSNHHEPYDDVHSNGYVKSDIGEDLDLENDLDDFPLIFGGNSNGSGLYGAVFNLTTSIIGAGIMALPATMKVLGLVLGVILIFLMGIVSEISVELLVRFTVQCKATSYGEVVEAAMGKTARVVSEICILVNNAGVLIVYLIIMGDVLSGSDKHVGVFYQWLGNGIWDNRKLVMLVMVVVFLAPLCVLSRIDSLTPTSAASVALAVLFVLITFVVASIKLAEGTADTPRLTPYFGSRQAILDLLVVIPIMSNAYICHFSVQPIYNELEGRTPRKMNRVGRVTTVICVLVYASTAVSGYLLFGKDTESDVLVNFDQNLGIRFSTALNYIVRVGYILHLILVFPVIHFSLRQTVDSLFFKNSAPLSESRKRCIALTIILLILIYIGSTMIPNIWTAFKFTGATTAVSLGFIFPPLVALRLSREGNGLSTRERYFSWFMLILAIIVSIVGVIGNIYTL